MVNQRLLPNYTSTPPPDEIENAFVPINTVTKEKTSLIRHDEMRLMTGNSENTDPHLKYLSEIMLPPTPDQDDMMPSPPSSHDDEDLFDILLKQRNQLHRAETMQTQKKRPRVDSLLTPCNSLSSDDNTFEGIHEEWTEEEEKTINKPYNYLTSHSGKDIRKQILAAFNIWLKIDTTHLNTINKVVGMLHNASLLIDDIQDSSPLRRGAPSAHTIFGTASTINSANYVYFQAMQTLSTLPTQVIPGALQIYCEELLNLHRGQGLDLYWRDTLTLPTESAYLKMVANKTGGLFRLAVRLMCLVSNCSFDFAPLIEKLGLIFQIRDDYKNLVSDTYTSQKGHCEDLTEGKFSFLIIHAIQNSPRGGDGEADTRIMDILALKTEDNALKDFVVGYMRDVTKTFEYTEGVLRKLNGEARAEMRKFGAENPLLSGLLDKLAA